MQLLSHKCHYCKVFRRRIQSRNMYILAISSVSRLETFFYFSGVYDITTFDKAHQFSIISLQVHLSFRMTFRLLVWTSCCSRTPWTSLQDNHRSLVFQSGDPGNPLVHCCSQGRGGHKNTAVNSCAAAGRLTLPRRQAERPSQVASMPHGNQESGRKVRLPQV